MKRVTALTVFILCSLIGFSQNKSELRKFSDTERHIIRYRDLSQQAWDMNDQKLALSYSDSTEFIIVGSYVDGHTFKTMGNKIVSLNNLEKPVLLITSATWCAPCVAEIPALNRVAAEFSDRISFVVLFHDEKDEKLAKFVKQYGRSISVVPTENRTDATTTLSISGFRHITGYPTNYSISTDKKIVAYSQGAAVAMTYENEKGEKITTTKAQAEELNYARLKEEAEFLLKGSH